MRSPRAPALLAVLTIAAAAAAEDEGSKRAREELERQLHEMVRIPPPQLELVFSGIDDADYALAGATFTLDNQTLQVSGEPSKGTVLFSGEVAPGPHTFSSQVTYRESPKTLFTYMSGTKFKVPGRVEFNAQRGLRLHIASGIHVQPGAELQTRLRPTNHVEPEMLMQVDDGSMPPELAHPKIGLVDSSGPTVVAEATPEPAKPAPAVEDSEPASGKKKGHGNRHAAHTGVVAAVAHDEHPHIVAAKETVETPKPEEAHPVLVAEATPLVAPPIPAVVSPPPAAVTLETEGMSTPAKAGIIGAVLVVALIGLTLVMRRKR